MTSFWILLLLQQLISIWFIYDFFLARDSAIAHNFWTTNERQKKHHLSEELQLYADSIKKTHCRDEVLNEASFDKVVFIVIDALGSDFIPIIQNSSAKHGPMSFLEELIKSRKGMAFVAKAATPTVTMPRIKALLSGTIPSFADILFNLACDVSNFKDDNIIRIAKSRNKSIVFYGDDTWLSLFNENVFLRYKQTFSFFATDYTTVDTNVTELALPETNLINTDWDFLILHYLGLDHIGHNFGSNTNPLIGSKLKEMDNVIRQVYDNMSRKSYRTLIVVCGDHGMSEEGNHGGDSKLEVNTALIMIPTNTQMKAAPRNKYVHQIDFAVTLALSLGMPIPEMSKGVAMLEFLENIWAGSELKLSCAALENLLQMINLTNYDQSLSSSDQSELLQLLKEHDSSVASNNSSLTSSYVRIARNLQEKLLKSVASRANPLMIMTATLLVMFITLLRFRVVFTHLMLMMADRFDYIIAIISIVTPILLQGSTDFIELCDHFKLFHVYYPAIVFSVFTFRSTNLYTYRLTVLISTYIISSFWSSQKMYKTDTSLANYILPTISVIVLCHMTQVSKTRKSYRSSALLIGVVIVLTKWVEESSNNSTSDMILIAWVQRLAMLITMIVYNISNLDKSLAHKQEGKESTLMCKLSTNWMLISFLIARKNQLPYLLFNLLLEKSLNLVLENLHLGQMTKVQLYITFAQAAFFNQGNSNIFSTIDVRPAFYGQTQNGYSMILSTLLVVQSTYSTQIFWLLKLFQRLKKTSRHPVTEFILITNFLSLGYYMFVCLYLRNHLFIWSVISPKLIYHFVTNVVVLLTVIIIKLLP